jgi:predicted HicB family RNase H-like nuclease
MPKPIAFECDDYEALNAWVARVLKLPFRPRNALIVQPSGAIAPGEAWAQLIEFAQADKHFWPEAQAELTAHMKRWVDLYLTDEGRKKAMAVVRQRRYRRKTGSVTLDLPKDIHQALATEAERRGVTLVELLLDWIKAGLVPTQP